MSSSTCKIRIGLVEETVLVLFIGYYSLATLVMKPVDPKFDLIAAEYLVERVPLG